MYYWALKKAVYEVQVYFLSSGARHVAILGLALTKLLCMYGYPLCKKNWIRPSVACCLQYLPHFLGPPHLTWMKQELILYGATLSPWGRAAAGLAKERKYMFPQGRKTMVGSLWISECVSLHFCPQPGISKVAAWSLFLPL